MLGLWSLCSAPLHMGLHTAFAVTLPDLMTVIPVLRQAGITPRASGGGAEIAEPMVFARMPAPAVLGARLRATYFDDPNGHSLEYIAMLDEPQQPDLGFLSLSAWRARSRSPA